MNAYTIEGMILQFVTREEVCVCDECGHEHFAEIEDEMVYDFFHRVVAPNLDGAISQVRELLDDEYGDDEGAWHPHNGVFPLRWDEFAADGYEGWQIELCGDDVAAALLGHPRLPLAL